MLFFLITSCVLLLIFPRLSKRKKTLNLLQNSYAHRGLHNLKIGIPENSLPAISFALLHNYGIELDVQLTKDEKVVVFHDNTLSRACGLDVPLQSKTYDELRQLSLFSTNEKIPLLTDVLKLVNGKVPLLIEIKLTTLNIRTCFLVDQILRSYPGAYMIESFNPFVLRWYKLHNPSVIRGQLSPKLLLNFIGRPDFLAYNYKDYKCFNYIIATKLFQIPTIGWTYTNKNDFATSHLLYNSVIFENFIPYK